MATEGIFGWVSAGGNVLVLTLKILALIAPFALIGGAIIWWYFKRGRFKIPVLIHEKTASGVVTMYDRGRKTRDKSGQISGFELMKYKKWDGRDIPTDFFETQIKKGGLMGGVKVVRLLRLMMDEEGNLHPIKPLNKFVQDGAKIELNTEWQGLTNSERIMLGNSFHRMKMKYQKSSWWEQNGSMVLNIATIVIMILGLFMIVNQLGDISETNAQAANAIARGLQAIGQNATQVIS